ncbi:MAG: hypothetical protein KJ725_14405 [Gammaproteobacteria bacterium]|nr:hypothetical protein [Gammaproteobacteria bacterium]
MLTSSQRHILKNCIELKKPLPDDIGQSVLVAFDLSQAHTGKRSLSYQDALVRRNDLLKQAFDALPGRKYSKLTELSGRIISGEFGADQAGRLLKQIDQLGTRLPSSIKQLHRIVEGTN